MRSELDISGLPIFYVNKIITTKTDDGNVMVVCGVKHGTRFTPLYASISPVSIAIETGESYVETARLAWEIAH